MAGCTKGEDGAPNAAAIREETTTAAVASADDRFDDEVATVNKRHVFVGSANSLRLSVNETVETTIGLDKCES